MTAPVFKKGAPHPPAGLTLAQQARWWMNNLQLLKLAISMDAITPEVQATIERFAKDNDIAQKFIDPEVVALVGDEGCERIYELLTGGGKWSFKKPKPGRKAKSRKTDVTHDELIRIAELVDNMSCQGASSHEISREAKKVVGDRYNFNTNKLIKKAKLAVVQDEIIRRALGVAFPDIKSLVNSDEEIAFYLNMFDRLLRELRNSQPEDFNRLLNNWLEPED